MAFACPHKVTAGAVNRDEFRFDLKDRNLRLRRKPLAKRLGQVGHFLKRTQPAFVEPAKDLIGTVSRLAKPGKKLREFVAAKPDKMRSRFHNIDSIPFANGFASPGRTRRPRLVNLKAMPSLARLGKPAIFLIALLALATAGCERMRTITQGPAEPPPQTAPADAALPPGPHGAFGNPTNATADERNRENFLIIGEGSVLSYNNTRGTANWVAWQTTRQDLGPSIPRPDFRPDPRLPDGFRRIGYYAYSGSGYNRGHLVPSADRFANPQLNEETFMMTNIVPKTAALNQGPWEKLERHARALARRLGTVQQIAGCYGEKERLKGKVSVPTNCWKIIVALPSGRTIADRDRRMQIIAVDMPNIEGIEDVRWEAYRTTVGAIEQRTGLDLSSLPR